MRVLVLRPEPAAGRTAARLAARGHEAVLLPLSQAEHDTDAASAGLAGPHSAIAITSAEAARVLALAEGTIKSRLHRAREALKRELERTGGRP